MVKAAKTNKKTIAAFMAVILAICIAFGLVMYRFITNPTIANAATTETKMKIDLYNGMDAVSRDESSLIDFTLSNIKDTLSASNQSLTPEQEEILKQSLSDKITELIAAGVLQYDENGNLTGESKSYFINEIMNTFKESCNGIDMEKEVDLGDIYTRLTNLENYVKQIDMNNQALVKTVENLTKAQVMVDGSSSNIDSEELQKTLDALKTDVEMKNYVQNNVTEQSTISGSQEKLDLSNASYEESIKQLQEAFNKMNETQAEVVNNLNTTITNLNQAVNDIATNSNDIADIKSLLASSTEELTSVKDSISQVKTELMNIIEANKAEAEASLNDLKNELNSYIDSNKTESSEELIAAKQELQEALNNASSLSEDERAKIQAAIDALDKTTQENFAVTNTTIETNKEESIQQLSLAKEDLENKINEASELSLNERTAITSALTEYQEAANNEMGLLNDNLEINKTEASDNLESVKQELLQLIGDNKTEITTALNNYISQTDAAIANLNALVEANKQEAANNLKTTKEQLEEALRTSDSVNSAERKKIQTALDNYITKTDAVIKDIKDSIKKANELIEANKNSAKIDLEAVRTELKNQMSDMKTELQNSINANKQEATNNLNTAKQELQKALDDASSLSEEERAKIQATIEALDRTTQENFAATNTTIETNKEESIQQLSSAKEELENKINEASELSLKERTAITSALTEYQETANNKINLLNDNLKINKAEASNELESAKQELLQLIGNNKTEIVTSLNNYILQTDTAIANLSALVESNKQEAANNLKTAKEQLEEALRTSDSINSEEREKIQTALGNYITKTDTAIRDIKDSIKKANELIEANKNAAKIDLEAVRAEMEGQMSDMKAELQNSINTNKQEATNNLNAAKQELQEALNDASSLSEEERAKIQSNIETLDRTTQENFATTNTTIEANKEESIRQLSLAKEELKNKINEASELSLKERTAITSALTEYQEAVNNEISLLNDNLEINKTEASNNLNSVKQELLQLIENNKTEITTALNNYISQTDTAIANLNTLIQNNKQEAANNLKVAKEQLEEALRTSDSVNSAERKKIQTALNNYITKTDAAIEGLKDSIKKANELIEANKNSAKVDLEAAKTELKNQMSGMKTELQSSMNTNKQEAVNNLNTAKQELQEALNNANSNNKTERDKISAALQSYVDASTQSFAEVNTKISNTNTTLDNAIRDLNASITALQKTVADNKKISDDSDTKLSQDITNLGNGLTAKIDSNTSEITNLKQQLSYYLGSGEHIKIDSINNITINKSGSANASANVYVWKANSNGTSSVTITNDYLKGCSSVQVNYKEQYNINPTYVINDETGTLTISVLSSFITGPVYINQVVIYHN